MIAIKLSSIQQTTAINKSNSICVGQIHQLQAKTPKLKNDRSWKIVKDTHVEIGHNLNHQHKAKSSFPQLSPSLEQSSLTRTD